MADKTQSLVTGDGSCVEMSVKDIGSGLFAPVVYTVNASTVTSSSVTTKLYWVVQTAWTGVTSGDNVSEVIVKDTSTSAIITDTWYDENGVEIDAPPNATTTYVVPKAQTPATDETLETGFGDVVTAIKAQGSMVTVSDSNGDVFWVNLDESTSPPTATYYVFGSSPLAAGTPVLPVKPYEYVSGTVTANIGTPGTLSLEATQQLLLAKLSADPSTATLQTATNTELASILAKIIAAPSTEAKQDTIITGLASILAKQSADPATATLQTAANTELASILAKLIAAPSTEAKQDAAITAIGLLAKLTDTQPVADNALATLATAIKTAILDQAKLTDTQPVSLASVPLASGAATEAKQDTGNTSLAAILAKLIAAPATEAKQDTGNTALSDIKTAQTDGTQKTQVVSTARTATTTRPTTNGTVATGAFSASFYAMSGTVTVNGVALEVGASREFVAPLGDTLNAIPYTVSAGSVEINVVA
jgi:hypothetical protein